MNTSYSIETKGKSGDSRVPLSNYGNELGIGVAIKDALELKFAKKGGSCCCCCCCCCCSGAAKVEQL